MDDEMNNEQNFSCEICGNKKFSEPVVTNCHHRFCWSCFYSWSFHRAQDKQNETPECPVCKKSPISIIQMTGMPSEPRVEKIGPINIPLCPTSWTDHSWKNKLGSNAIEITNQSSVDARSGGVICTICQGDEHNQLVEPVLTSCGHVYCWPCIFQSVKRMGTDECPICRLTIISIEPEPSFKGRERYDEEYPDTPARPNSEGDPFKELRASLEARREERLVESRIQSQREERNAVSGTRPRRRTRTNPRYNEEEFILDLPNRRQQADSMDHLGENLVDFQRQQSGPEQRLFTQDSRPMQANGISRQHGNTGLNLEILDIVPPTRPKNRKSVKTKIPLAPSSLPRASVSQPTPSTSGGIRSTFRFVSPSIPRSLEPTPSSSGEFRSLFTNLATSTPRSPEPTQSTSGGFRSRFSSLSPSIPRAPAPRPAASTSVGIGSGTPGAPEPSPRISDISQAVIPIPGSFRVRKEPIWLARRRYLESQKTTDTITSDSNPPTASAAETSSSNAGSNSALAASNPIVAASISSPSSPPYRAGYSPNRIESPIQSGSPPYRAGYSPRRIESPIQSGTPLYGMTSPRRDGFSSSSSFRASPSPNRNENSQSDRTPLELNEDQNSSEDNWSDFGFDEVDARTSMGQRGNIRPSLVPTVSTSLVPGSELTYIECVSENLLHQLREHPVPFNRINTRELVGILRAQHEESFGDKDEKPAAAIVKRLIASAKKAVEKDKIILPKRCKAGQERQTRMREVWEEILDLASNAPAGTTRKNRRKVRKRRVLEGPTVGQIAGNDGDSQEPLNGVRRSSADQAAASRGDQRELLNRRIQEILNQPRISSVRNAQTGGVSEEGRPSVGLQMRRESIQEFSRRRQYNNNQNEDELEDQVNGEVSENASADRRRRDDIRLRESSLGITVHRRASTNTRVSREINTLNGSLEEISSARRSFNPSQILQTFERRSDSREQARAIQLRIEERREEEQNRRREEELQRRREEEEKQRRRDEDQRQWREEDLRRRREEEQRRRDDEHRWKLEERAQREKEREDKLREKREHLLSLAAINRGQIADLVSNTQPREIKLYKACDPVDPSPEYPISVILTSIEKLEQVISRYLEDNNGPVFGITVSPTNGEKFIITNVDQITANSYDVSLKLKNGRKFYLLVEK